MSSSPCRHSPNKNFMYAVPPSTQSQRPSSTTVQNDLQKLQQELDRTRPAGQFDREVAAEIKLLSIVFESYGILDASQYPFRGIAEAVVRERWIEQGIWAFNGPCPDSRSEWGHSHVGLRSVSQESGVRRSPACRAFSKFSSLGML